MNFWEWRAIVTRRLGISLDPSTKRQLEKLGDDYLKQAQELRRDQYSHPGRISKI